MPVPFLGVPEFGDGLLSSTTSRSFLSRNANGTVGLFDASSVLTGTGTVNRVARWGANGVLGDGIMNDDGVNVTMSSTANRFGIGTSTPSVPLHVRGTNLQFEALRLESQQNVAANRGVFLSFYVPTGTAQSRFGGSIGVYNESSGNESYMSFSTESLASGVAEGMRLTGQGRLLIGTTTSGSERLRVNGDSLLIGNVGIGSFVSANNSLTINRPIVGGVTSRGIILNGEVQTGVTTAQGILNQSVISASNNLTTYIHFQANQSTSTWNSGVTTTQMGFLVDTTLVGATNNWGFRGTIPDGTGRWNLYMDGTAPNFLQGRLGIGSTSVANRMLTVGGTASAADNVGILTSVNFGSGATGSGFGIIVGNAVATGVTLSELRQIVATTPGISGSVGNLVGFDAIMANTSGYTGYVAGFRGTITSGGNRWNLFMSGSAPNHLAGKLMINTTTDTGELLIVNGIARVATVDNAVGNFVTWNSGTGRLTHRTASQALSDMGGWATSGNAPSVDTTFLGTTNARSFDIRVNNVIVATFAVGGAINFGSPSSSSSVLNIGGGSSIFAQGTITAPGITEDATAATNYLTLGGSNIIRRRSVDQVKSDLGIFDSIHNQTSTYQSANFRISGVGRFGAPAGYSEVSASSLFSNQNYSIRTPRLYVSNNDITGDLSGLGWRMIIDSGTATGEGLYIKGRILSTNNVSASSDRRLKKNISRLNNADVLSYIEGKTYLFGGKQTAGFIAQDVQKFLPHLVNQESNGFFSMDYVGLIPYIVEFIKSDRDKIKELEREVQKLKTLINVT